MFAALHGLPIIAAARRRTIMIPTRNERGKLSRYQSHSLVLLKRLRLSSSKVIPATVPGMRSSESRAPIRSQRLIYPMERQAKRFLNLVANKIFSFLFHLATRATFHRYAVRHQGSSPTISASRTRAVISATSIRSTILIPSSVYRGWAFKFI